MKTSKTIGVSESVVRRFIRPKESLLDFAPSYTQLRAGPHLKIKLVYNVVSRLQALVRGGREVGVKSEDRTERLAFHHTSLRSQLPASHHGTATLAALTSTPSRFQTTSDSPSQSVIVQFAACHFCPFEINSHGGRCTHARPLGVPAWHDANPANQQGLVLD